MDDDIPDDATEIVNAHLWRADLVKSPASGMCFVLAKSAIDRAAGPTHDVQRVVKSLSEDQRARVLHDVLVDRYHPGRRR